MYNDKVKDLVLASIVADAYCLGSHWIYEEKELKKLPLNWNELNNAQSKWHKGKKAGELTHYGDLNIFFYNFIKKQNTFDKNTYLKEFVSYLNSYNGYIDSSSQKTIDHFKDNSNEESKSTDLSFISRIPSLLLVSNNKKEFLDNVERLISISHNSNISLSLGKLFSEVLLSVLEGNEIIDAFNKYKEDYSKDIQDLINKGINSKFLSTEVSLKNFGIACSINDGLSGVLHILTKYNSFEDLMIFNAKVGGDNSSRAMMAAILFVAKNGILEIPSSYLKTKVKVV